MVNCYSRNNSIASLLFNRNFSAQRLKLSAANCTFFLFCFKTTTNAALFTQRPCFHIKIHSNCKSFNINFHIKTRNLYYSNFFVPMLFFPRSLPCSGKQFSEFYFPLAVFCLFAACGFHFRLSPIYFVFPFAVFIGSSTIILYQTKNLHYFVVDFMQLFVCVLFLFSFCCC